jgi:Fibronectin type III domain
MSGTGLVLGVLSAALVALPSTALAASAPAFGTTWVTSQSADSVTELSPTGAVVGVPIQGGATGLAAPQGVAADRAGHVFVANSATNSITEYANGASGNVAPIATISGSHTGLFGPTGLAISGTTIWVTDATTDTLEAFTAGTDGNVLPITAIYGPKTTLDDPVSISVGGEFGESLLVVNDPVGRAPSVDAFDSLQPGNSAPEERIAGPKTRLSDPRSAVDVIGKRVDDQIEVANAASNSITVYDGFGDGGANQPPVSVLAGSATKLDGPSGLGLDALGRLSVVNAGDGVLRVFSTGAHANAAPIRSVSGLGDSRGVGVLMAAPGRPTSVSATPANHSLQLSWVAPANTGGGILGYQVILADQKPGSSFLFSTSVNFVTRTTHFTQRRLKNGHHYFVSVFAVNEAGDSRDSGFHQGSPATVPGSPRSVALTPHTDALTVAWKSPTSNGGRAISRYMVRFASCTIGAKGCHAHHLSVTGSHHRVRLDGLSAGTAYHVEITARNSQGAGAHSKPVTGTPTA